MSDVRPVRPQGRDASPRHSLDFLPRATFTWLVVALGLAALGVLALDVSAYGLAHFLNSDFLTPYFFCTDLLAGEYPVKGWTLSASPYFVPDHLILCALFSSLGRTGFAYELFTLVFYPALFVLAGLCVRTVTGRTAPALVAGLLFGVGLLLFGAVPSHRLCLWWIGAPTCHGGVLLVGLAYLWILGEGLRRERLGRLPVGLCVLGFVGLWSDSLFLFQILLPASVALFLFRRRYPDFFRWQGGCALAALAVTQLFQPLSLAAGWFYIRKIIRVAPTPANQWHALGQFASDVPRLLRADWAFAALALAALVYAARRWRVPISAGANGGVLNFFRVFCVASLCIMLPLPVLSCGWRDINNVRYLFNWLVLPGFLLTLELAANWRASRHSLIGAAVVFTAVLVGGVVELRQQTLAFPYPNDVKALDSFLQSRGLRYGLAQYWNAKNITALSHTGAELRQLRPDGTPFFWDNNVFAYYEHTASGAFSWPAYQYILTDHLDEPALARAFGEPQAKENVGTQRVWIYDEEGQRRIRAALEPAVREKLGVRRLAGFSTN